MAKDFMAQMLDELMGRNRNAAPNERKELRFDDPTVCKHFLACYCPNELFTNTKADLGICKKIHDEELRTQYQNSSQFEKLGYEDSFLRFLKGMIQDVDRRIDRGKGRLDANKQAAMMNSGNKYDEKIRDLSEKIEELVKEAEQLGFQGRVDEAQQKLRASDQMRKERDGLRATLELAVQQEKQLEVCQICGAFLIVGDAQQRIDDHLSGKQHVGYAKIRETVAEEEAKIAKKMEERRKERASSGSARASGRDDERVSTNRNGRDRSRSRERSHRTRSKERSKRHRSRSRSGDRHKRRRSRSGGSRDRNRTSRRRTTSRERRNSKNKRRSRSREEKKRQSRDSDKNHSKSKKDHRRHSSSSSSDSSKSRGKMNSAERERSSGRGPALDGITIPKGNGQSAGSSSGDD